MNESAKRYRLRHPDRVRATKRRYYEKNREAILAKRKGVYSARDRETHLQRRYGIGEEEYQRLLGEQMGACAICRESIVGGRALNVDHDHETGRIRGLLCPACNRGIGYLRDNPELLFRAKLYLES